MQSAAAREQQIDDFIGSIISDIKANQLQLPTLPEVAMRVREAMQDEDIGAADIAKIITSDPGLSARLLQVANSPMYRGGKIVDSVQMAVSRMGTQAVRNLVISLVMRQLFQSDSSVVKARMQQMWRHSTEVAAISTVFAKHYTKLQPDQAMLAGLIHDIGILPVLVRAQDDELLMQDAAALDEAITKLHPAVGKLVLSAWQFSPELIEVAARHEDLDYDSKALSYTDVVQVANLHSYLGNKDHRLGQLDWNQVPSFNKLGLNADKSMAAMEEARADIDAVKQLLNSS